MIRHAEVAVIGAGTAGLTAIKELKKLASDFVLIDRGPLGTTCSRVGCMPSKALLQIAHNRKAMLSLIEDGIWRGDAGGKIDSVEALIKVRKVRDHFVGFALETIAGLGDRFIQASARFLGPNHLMLDNGVEIKARAVILATGSTPVIPEEWREFGDRIVTTDSLFERHDLEGDWAVIGAGPLGLEMSQALSSLGMRVTTFDRNPTLGGLKDPIVHDAALKALREDFPILLGEDVTLKRSGSRIDVHTKSFYHSVDQVLAAMGRRPNLDSLELDRSGCQRGDKGIPLFNSNTMKVAMEDAEAPHALYLAGDLDGVAMILHEVADDGRIAGYNATHKKPVRFKRKTRLAITFTSPNLAAVGKSLADLDDPAIGAASFENQGRSVIMGENKGKMQIYADKKTGKILGAEIAAPSGEHIAHLVAAAIAQGHSVEEMLRIPYYHPSVEEGLRTALRRTSRQLGLIPKEVPELERLDN